MYDEDTNQTICPLASDVRVVEERPGGVGDEPGDRASSHGQAGSGGKERLPQTHRQGLGVRSGYSKLTVRQGLGVTRGYSKLKRSGRFRARFIKAISSSI